MDSTDPNSIPIYRPKKNVRVLVLRLGAAAFLLLAVYMVFSWMFGGSLQENEFLMDDAMFRSHARFFGVTRTRNKYQKMSVLSGRMGVNMTVDKNIVGESCVKATPGKTCIEWKDHARVTIQVSRHADPSHKSSSNIMCYRIEWETLNDQFVPKDCFFTKFDKWYGGAEIYNQKWPIQMQSRTIRPYISSSFTQNKTSYGGVLERYWLSARGAAIYVDNDVPLHVGINYPRLCLKASYSNSKYRNLNNKIASLKYYICVANNMKEVHKYMAGRFWAKPSGIPDVNMFSKPIWSTKVHMPSASQRDVLDHVQNIKDKGFQGSLLEIDEAYLRLYGDHQFDQAYFPNPKELVKQIHDAGFKVSVWVSPFVDDGSLTYDDGKMNNYLIMNNTVIDGNKKSVPIRWKEASGAILDVTHTSAIKWFYKQLNNLRDIGIDTFKFDGGEANFIPKDTNLFQPLWNPDLYSKRFAEIAFFYSKDDKMKHVRVGYKTQWLPMFVRPQSFQSSWGGNRGLRSVIPSVLHFGLIGYPFVLPDIIGGTGKPAQKQGTYNLPERELYIRWLALNTFLPVMQFGVPPWHYDDEVTQFAKKMVNFHIEYVAPRIVSLARVSAYSSGDPIIRPLWWIDPYDATTHAIDCQFLIGDTFMVAPIVANNARHRDIYIPKGYWKDKLRGNMVRGPTWLKQYKVDLFEIAYFESTSIKTVDQVRTKGKHLKEEHEAKGPQSLPDEIDKDIADLKRDEETFNNIPNDYDHESREEWKDNWQSNYDDYEGPPPEDNKLAHPPGNGIGQPDQPTDKDIYDYHYGNEYNYPTDDDYKYNYWQENYPNGPEPQKGKHKKNTTTADIHAPVGQTNITHISRNGQQVNQSQLQQQSQGQNKTTQGQNQNGQDQSQKQPQGQEGKSQPGEQPQGQPGQSQPGGHPQGRHGQSAPDGQPQGQQDQSQPGGHPQGQQSQSERGGQSQGQQDQSQPGGQPQGQQGQSERGGQPQGQQDQSQPGGQPQGQQGPSETGGQPQGQQGQSQAGGQPQGQQDQSQPGGQPQGQQVQSETGGQRQGQQGQSQAGGQPQGQQDQSQPGGQPQGQQGPSETGGQQQGQSQAGGQPQGQQDQSQPGGQPQGQSQQGVQPQVQQGESQEGGQPQGQQGQSEPGGQPQGQSQQGEQPQGQQGQSQAGGQPQGRQGPSEPGKQPQGQQGQSQRAEQPQGQQGQSQQGEQQQGQQGQNTQSQQGQQSEQFNQQGQTRLDLSRQDQQTKDQQKQDPQKKDQQRQEKQQNDPQKQDQHRQGQHAQQRQSQGQDKYNQDHMTQDQPGSDQQRQDLQKQIHDQQGQQTQQDQQGSQPQQNVHFQKFSPQ